MMVDMFPRVFTYEGECKLAKKYSEIISKNIDSRLLPILMNNLITILTLENFIKNGTKRSSRKNKRGVIKEMTATSILKIPVLDFSIFNNVEIEEIMKIYDKYRDDTILNLYEALDNEGYMEMQKYLFNKFNINKDITNTIEILYNTRTRDLSRLGLELID